MTQGNESGGEGEATTTPPKLVKVHVTFTKELDVVVVGASREEVEKAAKRIAADGSIDRDWYGGDEWDVRVSEIRVDKFMTAEKLESLRCHCGVVDGEMLDISDFNDAKGTAIPRAND